MKIEPIAALFASAVIHAVMPSAVTRLPRESPEPSEITNPFALSPIFASSALFTTTDPFAQDPGAPVIFAASRFIKLSA